MRSVFKSQWTPSDIQEWMEQVIQFRPQQKLFPGCEIKMNGDFDFNLPDSNGWHVVKKWYLGESQPFSRKRG